MFGPKTTPVHHAARRRGGGMAARGTRAAGRARAADRADSAYAVFNLTICA
jgi:hypothetical protein